MGKDKNYWDGLVEGWKAGYKNELMPITEERPEIGKDVIVKYKKGQFRVSTRIIDFKGKVKFTLEDMYGPAIGWMPLPTDTVATFIASDY